MALVNMKQSAEEAAEANSISSDSREYPYGLEIRLDEEQLSKLGFTNPPPVGTQLTIKAMVTVTSASQYQSQDSEPESSSCWQITDLEVGGGASKDAAAALYPEQ